MINQVVHDSGPSHLISSPIGIHVVRIFVGRRATPNLLGASRNLHIFVKNTQFPSLRAWPPALLATSLRIIPDFPGHSPCPCLNNVYFLILRENPHIPLGCQPAAPNLVHHYSRYHQDSGHKASFLDKS